MSKIKLVIFDVDGTLYSSKSYEDALEEEINALISEFLKISEEESRERLKRLRRERLTVSASLDALGIPRREFYDRLARRVTPSLHIQRNPKLREMIWYLRSRGIKVAAHTNAGRRLATLVLDALGLSCSDFDIVITSDEAEPKPSREGYEYILKLAGVSPLEAVYVGDRPIVELRQAKELGLITICVRHQSSWIDYCVKDIEEAFNLLFRLIGMGEVGH